MRAIECEHFLDYLRLGDERILGSLRHLAFIIGGKMHEAAKSLTRDQIIIMLREYYCAPNRFKELWNALNDAERKIVSWHIWSEGRELGDYADEVAKEFNISKKRTTDYYEYGQNGLDRFKKNYADENSPLWLLFCWRSNNNVFYTELKDIVGEMKRTYRKVSGSFTFYTRENRTTEFVNIIRFCNSNKLTVTKKGALNKASATKLRNFCGYEDYAPFFSEQPEDMRTTESLLVTFPLITLCIIGGLLAITEGECLPGGKARSLIELPDEQLVKKLFDAYLKSKDFNEVSIIQGIRSKRGHHPFNARQNFAEELKFCPVGQPIYTKEFEQYLCVANRTFARKEERHVADENDRYNSYAVGWEQYERPLIRILLTFFAALGIVDIVWGKDEYATYDKERRIPVVFRLNPLGAYVLGMTDSYALPQAQKTKIKGGFTVLPDYTIVVHNGRNRTRHEIYFEKLFTKVSSTEETAIYKLDFETVVRALDSGTSIADLLKYLSASDKPLPENVARALNDWKKQTGRIRIRQVTILECEDNALLEEVIRYSGMGELVKEKISAAVVVDSGARSKIKKVIEKNKRFCKDVI